MTTLTLPTRKAEEWRYSDLDALAAIWPTPAPTRIYVAAGETARHHLLQDAAEGAAAVHDYVITIADGARCDFHVLNIGGKFGRATFTVTLGSNAHFELNGAIIGGGDQTLEIITAVTHAKPDSTSGQTIRSILGQHATGSYLGSINVARDAQRTDAFQSVKAMLLDRTATANAKPELEIYADDVKCAHGATVGELDRQALFYMASRGMDPATAKTLLLKAFVAGVFDDVADEAVKDRLEAAAIAKLETLV
ncbi:MULTISPECIES: SufD family Fe-S cluster assembly protein [unclassified Sphingobium]|uniref:SufD family Fe-S cluster assembly protein n=1 Tax=unclassified Sphingobium TaxID=2611147 RepID=UPI0007701BF8|nr:SufD family Fe-S cluster assembly protein [Sphingobium sp. TKS]AMK24962.1 SufBD protein [Sphingobium sp. TKS]NML89776.1 SufD family Fe-S cluster assembly protein [Sphingobium sp. TB-6]